MEPTQPTPPAPAPTGAEPLVDFVRTQRETAAGVLGVLAVVFLACGVYMALVAFKTTTPAADKPLTEEKGKADDPFKPSDLPKAAGEIENLKKLDYTVGWLACLLAFLTTGAGSAWLVGRLPAPTEAEQRTEARVFLLAVGMGLGTLLILAGLAMFYRWSGDLTKWLDTNETYELRYVIIPLMMITLGAGLIFAAIQPARSDERNNSAVRQVVYGANFLLTSLLLIVALVVFNVVVAVKVPNRLDTTETGFYAISDRTAQLLADLKEPVTAYAVLPDSGEREIADIRQLLMVLQDSGRGKFKLKFLSEVANKQELNALRAKYPQLDLALSQRTATGAVLLTVGEDEKRHAVIPDSEFVSNQGRKVVFQGEARLFRELVVLADTETKPIVYFTQSNSEMSIDPAAEGPDDRKLTRLRSYLEKNYIEVRPLTFPLDNPTVPADAAVVVVAEPRVPFSPAAAAAIKKYLADPAKKGRLLFLAGVVPGPNGQGVMKTGLEEVLAEFNVRLGNRFVYTFPIERNSHPLQTLAGFTSNAIQQKQEVALAIAKAVNSVSMFLPREVAIQSANPQYSAMPLFASVGVTWVEDDRIPEARLPDVIEAVARNEDVQRSRDLSKRNRPLGVLVSHVGTPGLGGAPPTPGPPLIAAYGNAVFVSDEIGRQGSPDSAPITFDLVGVTIDWLRGRPSIAASGIEGKQYSEYQFPQPATVDTARLEYLPIGLALLSITGLGVGVWFVRRR